MPDGSSRPLSTGQGTVNTWRRAGLHRCAIGLATAAWGHGLGVVLLKATKGTSRLCSRFCSAAFSWREGARTARQRLSLTAAALAAGGLSSHSGSDGEAAQLQKHQRITWHSACQVPGGNVQAQRSGIAAGRLAAACCQLDGEWLRAQTSCAAATKR